MAKEIKEKISKAQKARTKQEQKLDGGIGKIEKASIRIAMRQLWQRTSKARAICKKRAFIEKGMYKCEVCGDIVGDIKVDHNVEVGDLDGGYLERLWCSSSELTAMCAKCHNEKTKEERKRAKLKKDVSDTI